MIFLNNMKDMKSKKKILEGKWWKINNNIKETIPAKYDKIKIG